MQFRSTTTRQHASQRVTTRERAGSPDRLPEENASETPRSPEPRRFYRPELDSLRFFAFFAVFLCHTLATTPTSTHHRLAAGIHQLASWVSYSGKWGVDLFFCLSAYLITELLLRERCATGKLDVRGFYLRRVLRIWPLYFSFLCLAVVLHHFLPAEQMTWHYALGFFFFAGNWLYAVHPIATIAAPLWSVSIEEQFYLLWPLAVRVASRRTMLITAVGLLAAAFTVRGVLALTGTPDAWIYRDTFCRTDAIALGIILALVLERRTPHLSAGARALLLGGGLAAVSLSGLYQSTHVAARTTHANPWFETLGYLAVAVGCVTILLSVLGLPGRIGRLFCHPRLTYLGRISFGLYVFHQLGMLIGRELIPRYQSSAGYFILYWLFSLGVTLALAHLSFQLLERPFLALKKRYAVIPSGAGG